jgi:hypothetical protein
MFGVSAARPAQLGHAGRDKTLGREAGKRAMCRRHAGWPFQEQGRTPAKRISIEIGVFIPMGNGWLILTISPWRRRGHEAPALQRKTASTFASGPGLWLMEFVGTGASEEPMHLHRRFAAILILMVLAGCAQVTTGQAGAQHPREDDGIKAEHGGGDGGGGGSGM